MKKRLLKYLNILLGIAVAYLGFNLVNYWHQEKSKKLLEVITPKEKSPVYFSETKRGLENYAEIYRKNIFNLEPKSSTLPGPQLEDWKQKLLVCLKLRGTAVGYKSSCIIEDIKEHKQEIYQIGDLLREATVASIEIDQVTLQKDEDELVLYMDERKRKRKETPEERGGKLALGTINSKYGKIEHPSEDRWVVKKETVRKAAEDASEILAQLYLTPYWSGGRMEGFLINGIKSGSIAKEMGIKTNDIIKKVNGETLDSPRKIFKLYRQLKHLPSVQVEVERSGKMVQLTYDLK